MLLPDGPLPIPPLDCEEVLYKGPVLHEKRFKCTELSICNVDTLTASLELGDAACLNFANAEFPGGGYLHGARAQEEDLCRLLPQLHPALCCGLFI